MKLNSEKNHILLVAYFRYHFSPQKVKSITIKKSLKIKHKESITLNQTFTFETVENIKKVYEVNASNEKQAKELLKSNPRQYLVSKEMEREAISKPKYVRSSPIIQQVSQYLFSGKQVDQSKKTKTIQGKFEKKIGWKWNNEITPFPFEKMPTEAELKTFFYNFCKSRLEMIDEVIEIETDQYEEPRNGWVRGNFLARFKTDSYIMQKYDEDIYHKIATFSFNRMRHESKEDAIINLFTHLTGLSHYWKNYHLIILKENIPFKQYQYNWDLQKFEEKPLMQFEDQGNARHKKIG